MSDNTISSIIIVLVFLIWVGCWFHFLKNDIKDTLLRPVRKMKPKDGPTMKQGADVIRAFKKLISKQGLYLKEDPPYKSATMRIMTKLSQSMWKDK